MKTNKQKKEYFKALELEELDVIDYIEDNELEDINSFDDLQELLENKNAFVIEIIYYNTAMEYLKDNDTSLQYSLELAESFGYELKNLNSEKLASILAAEITRNDFQELENEIDNFFEN